MSFSQAGASISSADDVSLSSPADKQVLEYNSATKKWENTAVSALPLPAGTPTAGQIPAVAQPSPLALTYVSTVPLDTATIPKPLGAASPGVGASGASPADHVHPVPALTDLADQDASGLADGTVPVWNATAGKFMQEQPSLSAASVPLWQTLTSGIPTLPRTQQADSATYGATPASGTEHFTYFRADKSMAVGHIGFQTGSTAASGSTVARVGLYTVNASSGALTQVASCTNKTTFAGTYATQVCALSSSYTVSAGTIYAVGLLQAATTPASLLGMWYNAAFMGSAPLLAQTLTGQSDLAATVTTGLGNHQFPVYYELSV